MFCTLHPSPQDYTSVCPLPSLIRDSAGRRGEPVREAPGPRRCLVVSRECHPPCRASQARQPCANFRRRVSALLTARPFHAASCETSKAGQHSTPFGCTAKIPGTATDQAPCPLPPAGSGDLGGGVAFVDRCGSLKAWLVSLGRSVTKDTNGPRQKQAPRGCRGLG